MGKMDDPLGEGFLLPEHIELLRDHSFEETLVTKPVIDDQEFGEMNFRIYDSTQYDYAITVEYWVSVRGEKGRIESAFGVVKSIDPTLKRIKLVNDWDVSWINIESVVSVKEGFQIVD